MINSVIIKPTRECNADCSYCSAPPDGNDKWSIETFELIFKRIEPGLAKNCVMIWHGGEPMLMGPEFFRKAKKFVEDFGRPDIKFSIQTNLLLYKSSIWKSVFEDVFEGSCSSSFDPDETSRTIKGNVQKYSKQFYRKIKEVTDDGFFPMVTGTYSEDSIEYAMKAYEHSLSMGDKAYNLRYNYRYPVGRDSDTGSSISPERYGDMLLDLWERWITEVPKFDITPLDQMLKATIGIESDRCPWTRNCGGRFLGIEPNGDVYNCSEFADLEKAEHCYGNVITGNIPDPKRKVVNFYKKPSDQDMVRTMLMTNAARKMKARTYNLPMDCKSCPHFRECQGGCMRDAELFDRGLGGKFYYCHSWMVVFDKIKTDLMNGRVDDLLRSREVDPEKAKRMLTTYNPWGIEA